MTTTDVGVPTPTRPTPPHHSGRSRATAALLVLILAGVSLVLRLLGVFADGHAPVAVEAAPVANAPAAPAPAVNAPAPGVNTGTFVLPAMGYYTSPQTVAGTLFQAYATARESTDEATAKAILTQVCRDTSSTCYQVAWLAIQHGDLWQGTVIDSIDISPDTINSFKATVYYHRDGGHADHPDVTFTWDPKRSQWYVSD